jgi:glycosyltransferase involved in cell wall biosynthesis
VKAFLSLLILLTTAGSLSGTYLPTQKKDSRIVGLMAFRNEAAILAPCLRAMAEYTDAIVVLNDASDDDSLAIVQSLAKECNIERIIDKKIWIRDERGDKNALLYAGREIGGTHFILLDADEMFTAPCAQGNWLRKYILTLQPGQVMRFPMMNLWDGTDFYRDDEVTFSHSCSPHSWKWRAIVGVLCDDGVCNYDSNPSWGPSGSMHISRIPTNAKLGNYPPAIVIEDLKYGLLHFKMVNFEDLRVKRVWYRCLELIKANEFKGVTFKHAEEIKKINDFYKLEFVAIDDPEKIRVSPVPAEWIAYTWFDKNCFTQPHLQRKKDIEQWFEQYGVPYFEDLNIWHVEWMNKFKKE